MSIVFLYFWITKIEACRSIGDSLHRDSRISMNEFLYNNRFTHIPNYIHNSSGLEFLNFRWLFFSVTTNCIHSSMHVNVHPCKNWKLREPVTFLVSLTSQCLWVRQLFLQDAIMHGELPKKIGEKWKTENLIHALIHVNVHLCEELKSTGTCDLSGIVYFTMFVGQTRGGSNLPWYNIWCKRKSHTQSYICIYIYSFRVFHRRHTGLCTSFWHIVSVHTNPNRLDVYNLYHHRNVSSFTLFMCINVVTYSLNFTNSLCINPRI